MSITISFLNSKGGVGKTTSSVNTAQALCNMGKKVLVIDADAQCNATRMMGQHPSDCQESLYEVLTRKKKAADCIYMANEDSSKFDYIPASQKLYSCEQELVSVTGREYLLKMAMKEIKPLYDFIIIDCPPANGLVTVNAMCASDYLIVPINCEVFALDGMGLISAKTEEIRQMVNPDLEILGYVMSRYDKRLNLHRIALEQMEKMFGDRVFDTKIRTNIALAESPASNQNIFDFAPDSPGAEDYQALAHEILKRIGIK